VNPGPGIFGRGRAGPAWRDRRVPPGRRRYTASACGAPAGDGQVGKKEQAERSRAQDCWRERSRLVARAGCPDLLRSRPFLPLLTPLPTPDTWHLRPSTCLSPHFAFSSCASWRLGSTHNQANAPVPHKSAATPNEAPQPKREAIKGVSVAVTVLPICAPIFMTPDTEPADSPAMSAVTDQNVLCDK